MTRSVAAFLFLMVLIFWYEIRQGGLESELIDLGVARYPAGEGEALLTTHDWRERDRGHELSRGAYAPSRYDELKDLVETGGNYQQEWNRRPPKRHRRENQRQKTEVR